MYQTILKANIPDYNIEFQNGIFEGKTVSDSQGLPKIVSFESSDSHLQKEGSLIPDQTNRRNNSSYEQSDNLKRDRVLKKDLDSDQEADIDSEIDMTLPPVDDFDKDLKDGITIFLKNRLKNQADRQRALLDEMIAPNIIKRSRDPRRIENNNCHQPISTTGGFKYFGKQPQADSVSDNDSSLEKKESYIRMASYLLSFHQLINQHYIYGRKGIKEYQQRLIESQTLNNLKEENE